jgi:hypothetical protein
LGAGSNPADVGEQGRVPSALFGRRGAVLSAPLLGDPSQHLEQHLDLSARKGLAR